MADLSTDNRRLWEERYQRREAVLRYPFDGVVTFVFQKLRRPRADSSVAVLDFGCGAGNHLHFLVENAYDAYGVDVAPTALEMAHQRLAGLRPGYPGDRLALMDGNRIPFAAASFDAVIDRSSLGQNCAADIQELVAEIFRVLKPGGRYFGINFSDRHPDLRFGKPAGNGDYVDFSEGVFKGIGSRHFFNIDEVRKLFSDFTVDDIRLLTEESVMGKGGIVQVVVEAIKPR